MDAHLWLQCRFFRIDWIMRQQIDRYNILLRRTPRTYFSRSVRFHLCIGEHHLHPDQLPVRGFHLLRTFQRNPHLQRPRLQLV